MNDKPKIIFDPFPRNEEMVYTSDVEKELNEISNLITHFGSRAPDELIEEKSSKLFFLIFPLEVAKIIYIPLVLEFSSG